MFTAARSSVPLLFMAAALAAPLAARADLVTDSTMSLRQAIRDANTSAPAASRDFAILTTAIFDAVNGVTPKYESYRVAPAATAGSSAEAAAASAAHAVLTALYPAQAATFDANYSAQLGALPSGTSRDNGAAWGALVANNILNWRANDNANQLANYVAGTQPGDWRPTSPTFGAPESAQWPTVTPWIMASGSQFRPAGGPPALTSNTYAADYNEAFQLGSSTSAIRTEDQTTSAIFWSYAPGSQTAVGHWNSIAQAAIAGKGFSLVESARLFAALNTAIADAAIVASDAAYTYEFWRPIAAIREGATDGNASTSPLINWDPLVTTPLSPEYISANATMAGSAAGVLNYLLGTESGVSATSDSIPTTSIFFDSFDTAAIDASLAGIYGGIQFRSSAIVGLTTGQTLGSQVVMNHFQEAKIPEPSSSVLALLALAWSARRKR
ncbi:MAG: hypothetical protein JWL81_3233 [Verrucomicrobiales bacterium]|nr:hypothetical protein [Verrucomicrobiales bacterium]